MIDYDTAPDSFYAHQRALNEWAWAATEQSWPDDMDATVCGDWIDHAAAVLNVMDLPEVIRKVLLQRLSGGRHYCNKSDQVKSWAFENGDLELIQALAGPYPS